jgi:hypothetical protein
VHFVANGPYPCFIMEQQILDQYTISNKDIFSSLLTLHLDLIYPHTIQSIWQWHLVKDYKRSLYCSTCVHMLYVR